MNDLRDSVPLILLRHGPTDWSQSGLLQGRRDLPLSEAGRARVADWNVPPEFEGYVWVSSPLSRAVETAVLLGHPEADKAPALIEMDWGAWEGRNLPALRAEDPVRVAKAEARGLDLQPEGGESPRALQARLVPWLATRARRGEATVAVCHKGVIRAIYALATGWDMTGTPPDKLRDDCCHRFLLDPGGDPRVDWINIPLMA